ncbi:hypothetical protein Tco_1214928 [Tanacetum coccineum]
MVGMGAWGGGSSVKSRSSVWAGIIKVGCQIDKTKVELSTSLGRLVSSRNKAEQVSAKEGKCVRVESVIGEAFGSGREVDIIKKTENQAKMTKLSMEWKRLCKIKAKVQKCQSQSQYRRISSQTGAGTEEYY